MSASTTDAPTVRNLDIMSFTEAKPAKTAKVNNIDEKGDVPNNTFRPKEPFTGKVISNTTLTGPDAGEVCHIVFDHEGKLPYAEGQSIGIIADGTQENG
jgi:ferredoxin--NADP+ reductase